MSIKIYDAPIKVTPELDGQLRKTLVNHLLIYNHCLEILYRKPETEYRHIKKLATTYVEEAGLSPVIWPAAHNELYYQYKKFRKNVRFRKLIKDTQYLTFLVAGYNNHNLQYNAQEQTLQIKELEGKILLEEPLPETDGSTPLYINISYGGLEGRYRLNVYKFDTVKPKETSVAV